MVNRRIGLESLYVVPFTPSYFKTNTIIQVERITHNTRFIRVFSGLANSEINERAANAAAVFNSRPIEFATATKITKVAKGERVVVLFAKRIRLHVVIVVSRDANLTASQTPRSTLLRLSQIAMCNKTSNCLISYHDPYVNHMMLIPQPLKATFNTSAFVMDAMCNKTSPSASGGLISRVVGAPRFKLNACHP
jgi:hypothetical protein